MTAMVFLSQLSEQGLPADAAEGRRYPDKTLRPSCTSPSCYSWVTLWLNFVPKRQQNFVIRLDTKFLALIIFSFSTEDHLL
jgi:hypothetical protein